jgi:hypothetical protein
LGLWLHNLGALLIACFLPPLFLWWAVVLRRSRTGLLNLCLAVAATLVLWSPNLPRALAQAGDVTGGFWLTAPTVATVLKTMERLMALERLGSRDPWPLLLALEAWGMVWLWRRGRWPQAVLLGSLILLPLMVTLAVSYAVVPVFLDRTLIWVGLPALLALAAGVVGLPRPWLRTAGAAALLVLFTWGSAAYHLRKSKEPWREVAGAIAREWREGDLIALAPPYAAKPIGYYRRHGRGRADILVPRWEDPTEGVDRDEYQRRLDGAGRVWLVTRDEQGFDPDAYWLAVKLAQVRPLQSRRTFEDRLGLKLFGSRTAAPP